MDYRHLVGTVDSLAKSAKGIGEQGTEESGESLLKGIKYSFLTGIVKEVFSNPDESLSREYINKETDEPYKDEDGRTLLVKDVLKGALGSHVSIESTELIDFMPINSIVAYVTDNNNVEQRSSDIICYPFFPPHMSLPLKPGEFVWIIEEDVKGTPIYYWMCRKVGIRQLDDLNITHFERNDDIIDLYGNLPVASDLTSTVTHFDTPEETNLDDNSDYDKIALNSIAFREEFTGEPVPRQVKNCADLLFQGSNNSHIMLGTEKFSDYLEDPGESKPELFTGNSSNLLQGSFRKPLSPAIDICVGRKFTSLTELSTKDQELETVGDLSIAKGKRQSGENKDLEFMEINKTPEASNISPNIDEYVDKHALNCLSRLYMANCEKIDEIFDIPETITDESPAETTTDSDSTSVNNFGSLVAYAANTRVVSANTMKLYNAAGKSMIALTPDGDVIINAKSEGGAKIVLEAGGDIRIVPGENGMVYIGGEKNDSGIIPVGAGGIQDVNVEGTSDPSLPSIVTSAAGMVGEPLGSGRFSKKVKIK